MKTAASNSFLKFYVMMRTEIDLYGIAHVKVEFILVLKMCVLPILGGWSELQVLDNVMCWLSGRSLFQGCNENLEILIFQFLTNQHCTIVKKKPFIM